MQCSSINLYVNVDDIGDNWCSLKCQNILKIESRTDNTGIAKWRFGAL